MSPRSARGTPLAAMPVETRGPRDLWLQAKMTVGASTDRLEREADAVAARVVRGDVPGALTASGRSTAIHRACAECEEESLQRKGAQAESTAPLVDSALQQAIAVERGGGSPLPQGVRDDMESRFGQEFDAVRIHRSPRAAALAADLNAQAFTVGQSIFFGQDRYQPYSSRGRELLAHELTHTLQQRAHDSDGALQLKRELDDEALLRRAKVLRPLLKAWLKRAVRKELDTERFPEIRRRRAMMIRALVEHGLFGRELTEEEQQRLAGLEASAPASARPAAVEPTDDAPAAEAAELEATPEPEPDFALPVDIAGGNNPAKVTWENYGESRTRIKVGDRDVAAVTTMKYGPVKGDPTFKARFSEPDSKAWTLIKRGADDKLLAKNCADQTKKPCDLAVKGVNFRDPHNEANVSFSWNANPFCPPRLGAGKLDRVPIRSPADCGKAIAPCVEDAKAKFEASRSKILEHERGHVWVAAWLAKRANEHIEAGP